MRVIISGASGLIGSALSSELRTLDHEVVALVRRAAKDNGEIHWDPAKGELAAEDLAGADAVVHLAGAGIGDHRWTDEYKREVTDSRVKGTSLLAERIAECSQRPGVFLSGSAVGYYGASDSRELDERSPAGTGFLAEVCVQWEAATAAAETAGTRVAHLRTGIVLSPARRRAEEDAAAVQARRGRPVRQGRRSGRAGSPCTTRSRPSSICSPRRSAGR